MSERHFQFPNAAQALKPRLLRDSKLTFHCDLMLPGARMREEIHLYGHFPHSLVHT